MGDEKPFLRYVKDVVGKFSSGYGDEIALVGPHTVDVRREIMVPGVLIDNLCQDARIGIVAIRSSNSTVVIELEDLKTETTKDL